MEEKIINMLEQLYIEVKGLKGEMSDIKSELKETNKRLDNIENDAKVLKQGQERIETKLDNMEALNVNRHVELNGKVDFLSKDITFVEALAGEKYSGHSKFKVSK